MPGARADGTRRRRRHEPAPRRQRRPDRPLALRSASPSTGRTSPAIPATRWHPPCWPTASRCSAARSSITGRAACWRAGVDEPNALVTVLRGEVREPNIPATMLEIYDGLKVVSQNRFPSLDLRRRRGQPARRQAARRRLLLQDLHGAGFRAAEGHALLDVLRTLHPPRRRPWPRRHDPGPVSLRAHERLLRRAGGRFRPGRPDGRARPRPRPARASFWPSRMRGSAARPTGPARRSTANRRPTGRPASRGNSQALTNVTLLPRTTVWGYYDGNTIAALERVADHKAEPAAGRTAPPPLDDPRRQGGARHRRVRTAAGVPGQRPTRRDAGERRRALRRRVRRAARREDRRLHQQ